jgi:hypothetical protein
MKKKKTEPYTTQTNKITFFPWYSHTSAEELATSNDFSQMTTRMLQTKHNKLSRKKIQRAERERERERERESHEV